MPLNISYYRTNGEIKAFPKFNNRIYAFGPDKPRALKALRAKLDYIMWLQDQYITGEITKEHLADMLGIDYRRIDSYISKNNLVLKDYSMTEEFYPDTTQVIILRRLRRGCYIKQFDNRFYLCNVSGSNSYLIAKERNPSIEELIVKGFIKQNNNKIEHVLNNSRTGYTHIKFTAYVIAIKGIMIDSQALNI